MVAEINFVGVREICLCEFERGTGAREIYSSVDQTNKVKTKKKVFSSKISTNSYVKTKKKRSRPKSFMNLGVLGLDLHYNSPEPVNFFGAQS